MSRSAVASSTTARMISRFNPAVWIIAVSRDAAVCQGLAFSYGVQADPLAEDPEHWRDFARNWLREHQLPDGTWEESITTGTGFPQVFYIQYHLYKDYFPILALGTYAKHREHAERQR